MTATLFTPRKNLDISHQAYKRCELCPRRCLTDRTRTTGICGERAPLRAARAALHFWEEPLISGTRGSGAVFFSGCSLRCTFCQNNEISQEGKGVPLTQEHLTSIFLDLQSQGAHNINIVTGTHFIPTIIPALIHAQKQGLSIPIVWNTGGYERPETIRAIAPYIDIWLVDVKFGTKTCAGSLTSPPAYNYYDIARASLIEMGASVELKGGELIEGFDAENATDGSATQLMKRGIMVRHLVMPQDRDLSSCKGALKLVKEALGQDTWISLMSQYIDQDGQTLSHSAYKRALGCARSLGFTRIFTQDRTSATTSYTPSFNGEGIA